MIRTVVQRMANSLGFHIVNVEHLGVEVELDIDRLSAHATIQTIFDIGANFGQTAARLARHFRNAKIYSFEPIPESFARLSNAIAGLENVRAFNIALGDHPGSAQMNLAAHSGSNSLKDLDSSVGSVQVRIETVDEFCAANQVSAIDLMKIDVEGYELEVLKGAEKLLNAGAIRFIYAECILSPNPHMPHTCFFDLQSFLTERGFCLFSCYPEAFLLDNGVAVANALFVRRKGLPSRVPGRVHNIGLSASQ